MVSCTKNGSKAVCDCCFLLSVVLCDLDMCQWCGWDEELFGDAGADCLVADLFGVDDDVSTRNDDDEWSDE